MKRRHPLDDPEWYQLDPIPDDTPMPRWIAWGIVAAFGAVFWAILLGAI